MSSIRTFLLLAVVLYSASAAVYSEGTSLGKRLREASMEDITVTAYYCLSNHPSMTGRQLYDAVLAALPDCEMTQLLAQRIVDRADAYMQASESFHTTVRDGWIGGQSAHEMAIAMALWHLSSFNTRQRIDELAIRIRQWRNECVIPLDLWENEGKTGEAPCELIHDADGSRMYRLSESRSRQVLLDLVKSARTDRGY